MVVAAALAHWPRVGGGGGGGDSVVKLVYKTSGGSQVHPVPVGSDGGVLYESSSGGGCALGGVGVVIRVVVGVKSIPFDSVFGVR